MHKRRGSKKGVVYLPGPKPSKHKNSLKRSRMKPLFGFRWVPKTYANKRIKNA